MGGICKNGKVKYLQQFIPELKSKEKTSKNVRINFFITLEINQRLTIT